jgi:hypothetical protein
MDEKQAQRQAEKHKAIIEYVRFLTTLSTGSIVLLVSFLDKLDAEPSFLVGLAFLGFSVCIITAVIAYTSFALNYGHYFQEGEGWTGSVAILLTLVSFIIAIIALTIFGMSNL